MPTISGSERPGNANCSSRGELSGRSRRRRLLISSTDGVAGGISVRCTDVHCVTSELYSPDNFYLLEGKDPAARPIEIAGRAFAFSAGRAYRMVVRAVGDHVEAWIDGTLVGAGAAFVTSGGYVTVFVYDFDAHATAYVDVQRFFALVPSGQ